MTDQKNELSKLCFTGFILSILSPILLLVTIAGVFNMLGDTFIWVLTAVILLMPLVGLVLSIIGIATAKKKNRKGKGFGIAGIILPCTYAVVAIFIFLIGYLFTSVLSNESKKGVQSDLYVMEYVGQPVNTEYDVSDYKIPLEVGLSSFNASVSKVRLRTYAESKLQTIDKESENSIRGKYEDYYFLIVRSNHFNDWLEDNKGNIYKKDGYYAISFYASGKPSTGVCFDMYMDPSGEYIIITDCADYKVITEFFESIN